MFPCKLLPHKFMNDSSIPQDAPVCKPTKWFLWRALAMLVMFSVFAVLFLMDGISGYRDKNLQWYVHENFVKAGTDFQNTETDGGLTESSWQDYAKSQKCKFPEDASDILPKGVDLQMPWPDALVNGYAVMSEKGAQNGAVTLWVEYSSSEKWDKDPGDHPMHAGKIKEQFYAATVAGVLIAITLFFLVRTMRRSIHADEEALYTQDDQRIPYTDMVRIDKRKWDTKGLALIYYKDGGEEKKAKIDGMVYGQFKEEDGAPAEKLFSYVMKQFKGEVIEYVSVDENEADEAPLESSTTNN